MKDLINITILALLLSGCATGLTQEQIQADAVSKKQALAVRESEDRYYANVYEEREARGSKLRAEAAEKQAKIDAEKKAKEEARQKEAAARQVEDEARSIAKNKKQAELVAEYQKVKPKCTEIRFTGIATPQKYSLSSMTYYREPDDYIRRVTLPEISDFYTNPITRALASMDIEDTLARNPIQCGFYDNNRNLSCKGVSYFENKKGTITEWWKDFYIIDTTLDFNTGRKNLYLVILRKDARCAK